MPKYHKTPLEMLDNVIAETVLHINDSTNKPTDFTRNRKLNAQTTIKTILNMQGNSLNTEFLLLTALILTHHITQILSTQ